MKLDLIALSKLLKIEILDDNIGEIPYLPLNDKYIITENLVTKELEINNLESYEWQVLSVEDLTKYLSIQLNTTSKQ